jgi:hypothetical protein
MRDKFMQAVRNEPSLMRNTGIDAAMLAFIGTTLNPQAT